MGITNYRASSDAQVACCNSLFRRSFEFQSQKGKQNSKKYNLFQVYFHSVIWGLFFMKISRSLILLFLLLFIIIYIIIVIF